LQRHNKDDPTKPRPKQTEDADGNIWGGTILGLHRLRKPINKADLLSTIAKFL
jgi:hypothetical protein